MEITAPGGNLEKIRYAALYGADAVYCAYNKFGLRAFAGNLDQGDILEAISFCHQQGTKLYLTLNIYARNTDFAELRDFVQWLATTDIDGVIISDPGVFELVKNNSRIPIHISTQANITNVHTAKFWFENGAKRIIPARELCFEELLEIKTALPKLEVETFIHGAMCISWSGRCLLSAALNNRSANYGECTHPCRWNWALTEESRPGELFPIHEDQYGTYVLSSKDLCLLDDIPKLAAYGFDSGKIEGRMKSAYYVAQICRIYKRATITDQHDIQVWNLLRFEIEKVSHRPYYRGFFDSFDQDTVDKSVVNNTKSDASYDQSWQFCAKNLQQDEKHLLWFDCLAKLCLGDEIEIIFPRFEDDIRIVIKSMIDEDGSLVQETKPNRKYAIEIDRDCPNGGMIRKWIG